MVDSYQKVASYKKSRSNIKHFDVRKVLICQNIGFPQLKECLSTKYFNNFGSYCVKSRETNLNIKT